MPENVIEVSFIPIVEEAAKRLSVVPPGVDGQDLRALVSELKTVIVEKEPAAGISLLPILLSISKSVRCIIGLKLAEIGFFNGQDELLIALGERTPLSISAIAAQLNVRASTISKMVTRLSTGGFVTTVRDVVDTRLIHVVITPRGLETRLKIIAMHDALERELLKGLGDTTGSPAAELSRIEGVLRRHLSRLR